MLIALSVQAVALLVYFVLVVCEACGVNLFDRLS